MGGSPAKGDLGHGFATGQTHYAVVSAHPNIGVEAGMPRNGWYARGIAFDLEQRFKESYVAYGRARTEFDQMLRKRPRWAASIQQWKAKADFQRTLSRRLRPRTYRRYLTRPSYLEFDRAEAMHHKWLAAWAFTGRLDLKLGKAVVQAYEKVLLKSPHHDKARLCLAAATHLMGKPAEARRHFQQVRAFMLGGFALETAHYYTVTGDRTRAFEYLARATRYSRGRRTANLSNMFDPLRTDERFQKLVTKK